MPTIQTTSSESTCGEACWCAHEDICRCSCNGRNHGVLRSQDGERPERTRKLNGYIYRLIAVETTGGLCRAETQGPLRELERAIMKRLELSGQWNWYDFASTPGYPIKLKTATEGEIARWPELSGWRGQGISRPLTAWMRVDMPEK